VLLTVNEPSSIISTKENTMSSFTNWLKSLVAKPSQKAVATAGAAKACCGPSCCAK
jgi:hypothetical protein